VPERDLNSEVFSAKVALETKRSAQVYSTTSREGTSKTQRPREGPEERTLPHKTRAEPNETLKLLAKPLVSELANA